MKKLIPLLLLPTLLAAQPPATTGNYGVWDANHFLWFTGHWSKSGSKRTFIVDKGNTSASNPTPGAPASGAAPTGAPTPGTNTSGGTPGTGTPGTPADPGTASNPDDPPGNPSAGGTITVNPDGSVSMDNGNVDAWNKKMDDALNNEQKYLKGLQDPGDNLDPTTHHLDQLLVPGSQQRVQDIQAYKVDPKDDMLGSGDKSSPPAPARSLEDIVADGCKKIKPDYDQVMDFYTNQVKGGKSDLKYPKPPEVDYDCYSCDSNLRIQFDTLTDRYVRDFAKDEAAIAKKGFAILHDLGLLNISTTMVSYPEGLGDLFHKSKTNPAKSGACSYIDVWDLSTACYAIVKDIYKRAAKMVQDNKKNYKAVTPMIKTYLTAYRTWCLVSGEKEDESILPMLQKLLDDALDHYLDELKTNDWRQIANFPLMLDLLRSADLMGGTQNRSGEYYTQIIKIVNSFRLTVDMDIKIGANKGYKIAHLKGECHIMPSFQEDQNQCYKWVVADEDRQTISLDGERHGFYMAKQLQNFDATLVTAQIVGPGPMPKYTGTKKFTVHLGSLAMDFCHPGNDTINLTGFTANPPTAGTWTWPNGTVTTEGVIGMEQYFEDINNKKKFATDGEASKAKEELKTQAEKLKAQMEALKSQMTASQGNTPPGANMEKMMELKDQALSKVSAPIMAKMVYLYFLLPVQNNNQILVDIKYDAKKINPQESDALIYGYYTVHIENKANGTPAPKQPRVYTPQ